MSPKLRPWQTLHSTLLLERQPWFAVYQDRIRLGSGRVIDDFYRVVLTDYVVMVAVTAQKEIVAIREYRQALGRISLSLPAGGIEPDETPLAAAQRELLEETGYASDHWSSLGQFVTDPNRHCGMAHLYLAREAKRVSTIVLADDLEELHVETTPIPGLLQSIAAGEFASLPVVAALGLALAHGI